MKNYETVVIFDQKAGDAAIKEGTKKVEELIATHGGSEIKVSAWGRKEIPHIHGKFVPGHIVSYEYVSSQPGTVAGVEGILRITDSVTKFQSHRTNLPQRKFRGSPHKANPVAVDDGIDGLDTEY